MTDSSWIIETRDETFESDVFNRSQDIPVVVDFWGAHCQPCLMLAPQLSELVEQAGGKVILVKANVEDCPQAAGQFQVNGIPAVFAVLRGQVTDYFEGLLPRDQLAEWLERVTESGRLLEAEKLEVIDPAAAEAIYNEGRERYPNDPNYALGLARLLLTHERHDECRELIGQLEDRGFLEPEGEKIKAQLELAGLDGGQLAERRATADAEPENLPAQLALAESLAANQEYEEALEICLGLVEKDRQGVGESARQVMVDLFRVLPDDSDLTRTYRRRLASVLY